MTGLAAACAARVTRGLRRLNLWTLAGWAILGAAALFSVTGWAMFANGMVGMVGR